MSKLLSKPAILRHSSALTHPGHALRGFTTDNMMTYDQYTIDSTGAYLNGELERLDPKMNDPLVSVSWSRDIELREDVTIADEQSSFTNNSFAAPGGINPTGKNWISKEGNQIAGISLDIGKTLHPLNLWGSEIKWTIPELESAMKLGRPVDASKLAGLQLKWQMDIDQQVYIGDTDYNLTGMLNDPSVTVTNVASNGTGNSPLWINKTFQQILNDINTLLESAWAASGFAVMPSKLLLPPLKYSYLVSTLVGQAGSASILTWLKDNSLCNSANGKPLDIQPVKWLTGRGVSGVDRMMVYDPSKERIRFPLVPLQRTPLEYRSIWQMTTYFGRLGCVEFPYSITAAYADGV